MIEEKAESLRPALEDLIRQAAQGEVAHNDDTGMRIPKLAREPAPKGKAERSGVFTSGIVSRVGARLIGLFFSGWRHAGENLAEVLKRRSPGLPPLIQMCDALSRNTPKLSKPVKLSLAYCLAHGRRQFVEVAANFPEQCRFVLETLGGICAKVDVLVLDDCAMAPLKDGERRDILEICDDRYQRRSMILTSQMPVPHWHEQIGDPTVADSILDRLIHNAYRIELNGESIRKVRGRKPREEQPQ